MKVTEQLAELEAVADKLGVKIGYEPMTGLISGRAGLCRVKGQYRIIVDRRLKPAERAHIVADALSRFDVSSVEMPDPVRRLLEGPAPRKSA